MGGGEVEFLTEKQFFAKKKKNNFLGGGAKNF